MHCFGAENVNMYFIFYQFHDQRSTKMHLCLKKLWKEYMYNFLLSLVSADVRVGQLCNWQLDKLYSQW